MARIIKRTDWEKDSMADVLLGEDDLFRGAESINSGL
jgi:hypothetical protein